MAASARMGEARGAVDQLLEEFKVGLAGPLLGLSGGRVQAAAVATVRAGEHLGTWLHAPHAGADCAADALHALGAHCAACVPCMHVCSVV
eukprot:313998-Chlamydomonas_euryale.AAC.1